MIGTIELAVVVVFLAVIVDNIPKVIKEERLHQANRQVGNHMVGDNLLRHRISDAAGVASDMQNHMTGGLYCGGTTRNDIFEREPEGRLPGAGRFRLKLLIALRLVGYRDRNIDLVKGRPNGVPMSTVSKFTMLLQLPPRVLTAADPDACASADWDPDRP